MTEKGHHTINKQILKINIDSDVDAFQTQQKISDLFKNQVIPQLSDFFDFLSPVDSFHLIDKLEINVGKINNINKDFVENSVNAIKNKLQEKINEFKETGIKSNENDLNETKIPFLIFINFVETGTFPWWAENISVSNLETQIKDSVKNSHEKFFETVENYCKNNVLRKRIVLQFSADFIEWLIINFEERIINPQTPSIINDFRNLLSTINSLGISSANNYMDIIFDLLLKNLSKKKSYTLKNESIYKEIQREIVSIENKNANISDNKKSELLQKKLSEIIQNNFTKNIFKESETAEALNLSEDIIELQKNNIESIHIENSGLIILWQFLPELFKNLGYTKDNKFISEIKQEQAIGLTDYMVYKETEIPEYRILLNKIICGWNIEIPVKRKFHFSAKEKKEIKDFLKSIITHWSALKNTSIEGLQKSFLNRKGKLSKIKSGWLLVVERNSYDVLLDMLPWSTNTVKLPWMQEHINTEW
ncbi:MAG: contractile injection system tape measure protein [Bacteroidales bacterium]|jgi:hypothetical protein